MKLSSAIRKRLAKDQVFSSVLWKTSEHENPIVLVRVPSKIDFSTYSIVVDSIVFHHDDNDGVININFTLLNFNDGLIESSRHIKSCLNPYSIQDRDIGYLLATTHFITFLAVSTDHYGIVDTKLIYWSETHRANIRNLLELNKDKKKQQPTSYTITTIDPAHTANSRNILYDIRKQINSQGRFGQITVTNLPQEKLDISPMIRQKLTLLPIFTGLNFTINEFHDAKYLILSPPLLLVKLPETYPFQTSSITFKQVQRYDISPQGSIICILMSLRHPGQKDLLTRCLFVSSSQDDYKVLTEIASRQFKSINIVAVGNTQSSPIIGVHTLDWPDHLIDETKRLIQKITFLRQDEKHKIRMRWIKDYLHPSSSLKQLPSSSLPDIPQRHPTISQPSTVFDQRTLHGKYRTKLLDEIRRINSADNPSGDEEKQRAIQNNLNSLKYAHICRVKNSALHMLHDLLTRQQGPLLEKMPPLPASNFWLEFDSPIPPAFGNNSVDIWAVWIRESTSEIRPGRQRNLPTSRQWICTLLGKDAIEIGYTYQYSPEQLPIWSVTQDYRCPHKMCMPHRKDLTKQELCANCRADLESWEKILHLLLLMYRGDYAEREDVQRNNRSRIIVEQQQNEPDVQRVYSMKYIDATAHQVYHNLNQPVPRGSWLAVLRATHPELIEEAEVWTKPHERYVSSLQSSVHVQGHYKTRYLRKDKVRKSTLTAKQYPDTFDK